MKELVCNYKADVFTRPILFNNPYLNDFSNLKKLSKLIKQLSVNATEDEHELIYLLRSMELVSSELDMSNSYTHSLMNAIKSQLSLYIAGYLEMIAICSLVFHLFTNSPELIVKDLFILFLIENANTNIQSALKKLKPFYLTQNLINILIPSTDLASLSSIPKNIVTNSYEFTKSSVHFFYHKMKDSTPVRYELPFDIQESINHLENMVLKNS